MLFIHVRWKKNVQKVLLDIHSKKKFFLLTSKFKLIVYTGSDLHLNL